MKTCKYALAALLLLGTNIATASPAIVNKNKVQWQQVNNISLAAKPLDISYSLDGKFLYMLTDDSKVHIYDNKGALQGIVPVEKGVTSIDISPKGEYLYLGNSEKQQATTLAINFVIEIPIEGSPYLGKKDAPVTVAVFSDFQ